MVYLARTTKSGAVGFVIGRDYANVLREVSFVVRELGIWDAELRVDAIHDVVVPLPFRSHPMRMRFEIHQPDNASVKGVAVILPEECGGDLFSVDLPAWFEFVKGWSPDGDFELDELEVAQTAAN